MASFGLDAGVDGNYVGVAAAVAVPTFGAVVALYSALRHVKRRQLVVADFAKVRGTVAAVGSLHDVPKPVVYPPVVLRRLTAVVLLRRRRVVVPHKPPKPRMRLLLAHRLAPPPMPPSVVAHSAFRRQVLVTRVRLKPVVHCGLVVVRPFDVDQLVFYAVLKAALIGAARARAVGLGALA